ncbi:MAG: MMPL family transporter [Lachnospiraceae bacterium]|nr:MMPL family transporter [Lachnospiraceae bacterium]
MKLAKAVVKYRVLILIVTLALMVPSVFGYINTRVNYDMLNYLPEDMETVIGQDELMKDFSKGAFSLIILEDMPVRDITALKEQIEKVEHVDTVVWYDTIADVSIPLEILPDSIYKVFNTDRSTMMAVFFDSSTSADVTMDAIREIRKVAGKQCFVSGLSAMVTDLKDLCEREEPIYVGIAVLLALAAMMLLLDNWLIPIVFLLSIGMMIILNLGTNLFLGEISYITKALSAVLQLAVTMDYSIFLWHSYNEALRKQTISNGATGHDTGAAEHASDKTLKEEAMAEAIHNTLTSVIGSSVTTIAGFVALCFMTFTMGKDLGLVMAKGVVLGVLGCVTVLPSMILIFDKPLKKLMHRSLIPDMGKLSGLITKRFPIFLVLFIVITIPAFIGYQKTNNEVYYDMADSLPQDLDYAIANAKLKNDFDVAATHMVLASADLSAKDTRAMIKEMEKVDGIKFALGLDSLIGAGVPEEILPDSVRSVLKSDKWKLILVNSEYRVASDAVNEQLNTLNAILKKYDPAGMLIGEAPCMKDMIETTDRDFRVVNIISIAAIFIIIALVEQSLTLPFILIAVIEAAIFINLGLPHYLGDSLPFIAPICISTIQLGATVDYAILMTTRYKKERIEGNDKVSSIKTALATSIPSIIVSGMGLFSATFGVAVYSDIDMISSMCILLARGAIISVVMVVLTLPAMLMLFDKIIIKTTAGMKTCNRNAESIDTEG